MSYELCERYFGFSQQAHRSIIKLKELQRVFCMLSLSISSAAECHNLAALVTARASRHRQPSAESRTGGRRKTLAARRVVLVNRTDETGR